MKFFLLLFFITACSTVGVRFNEHDKTGHIEYCNGQEEERIKALQLVQQKCNNFQITKETVTYYYSYDSIHEPFGLDSDLNIFLRIVNQKPIQSYTTLFFMCQ